MAVAVFGGANFGGEEGAGEERDLLKGSRLEVVAEGFGSGQGGCVTVVEGFRGGEEGDHFYRSGGRGARKAGSSSDRVSQRIANDIGYVRQVEE